MKRIYEKALEIGASIVVRRAATVLVLSATGTAILMQDEGTVNTVYLDPVKIATVCTGHVTREHVGTQKTDAECAELLVADTGIAQAAVRKGVAVPISQTQYDRLVSFTFNVGVANFKSSTLLRKLNAGECRAAAEEFLRWTKARGQTLKGLVLRRQRDRDAFIADCP
jgi:lysozyme